MVHRAEKAQKGRGEPCVRVRRAAQEGSGVPWVQRLQSLRCCKSGLQCGQMPGQWGMLHGCQASLACRLPLRANVPQGSSPRPWTEPLQSRAQTGSLQAKI